MKLLAIIPAYNEEKSIVAVVEAFTAAYPQYDYLIVNDGGHDRTLDICREHGYHIVSLPINLGLAGAFQTGMKYAYRNGYDVAIQLDGDGQHLPEYIEPMLDKLSKGYDIVIGSRFLEQRKPFNMRMLGSHLISFAIRITTGKKVTDPTSGMRMFNHAMIREFAQELNHAPEPDTISYLLRHGLRLAEIPVQMQERTAGTSYLTATHSIAYMLRMGISILLIQWFRGGTNIAHDKAAVQEEIKS
ncbi:MAG: glycosyltransferase family 2 protein [Ruthenibacterium sp.]